MVALEITESPEAYFKGDKVDLSEDFTVMATRNDGQKVEVAADDLLFSYVSGSFVTTTNASNDAKSEKIGTITYNGIYQGTLKAASVDVYATVYTVDAIGVELNGAKKTYYDGSSIADINDDYVVTGYALKDAADTESEVLYSRELGETAYTITYSDETNTVDTTKKEFKKAGDVTLTFKAAADYGATDKAIGKAADKANEALITVMKNYVTGFEVKANEDKPAVIGAAIDSTGAKAYVEVTYTVANGKTGTATEIGITDPATIGWVNAVAASGATFEENTAYTVKVSVVVGADSTATATEKTLPLELKKNTLVSFKVAATTPADVKDGYEITKEKLTISDLEWLDEDNAPAEVTGDWLKTYLVMTNTDTNATVTSYKVTGYGEGATLPLAFSLTGEYASATCDSTIQTATT